MSSYNLTNSMNSPMNSPGIENSSIENHGLFSRILRSLSNYNMNYNDMVVKNQVGVGINEDPHAAGGDALYDFFSKRAVASVLNRKSIPYLDRSYSDKRRILREYSIKDEIRDFVSSIADESIIYNDDDNFCSPKMLSNEYSQEIRDKYQENFQSIYNKFGFADNITAWTMMRDFLIDGFIAVEIIYDNKKKNIIGFTRLRPETLVPAYEPDVGHLWIQYPEDPQLRRIFLDSQIIYISYSSQNDYKEVSYIEGLIKPYNQLKIIEQTRIMFNVLNAQIYQKFTIPTKGLSRQRAEEQIGQLIHDYSEEVEWDDDLGELRINGEKHLHYNKQIWFPEGDQGTPDMEIVKQEGHDLNDETMLDWFYRSLKRASKIPMQRFEAENGGGNLYTDASEMTRDEIKFHNFINRLRANFKELIIKPLKLQILIDFPELKDDEKFINQVDITFYTNQLFEEWKKINNLSKKADILSTLTDIQNPDGTSYFHIEWLMDNIFKLSQEDKQENQRYWSREKGNDEDGEGDGEDGGGDEGGGMPSEGGDIDSDMDEGPPEEAGGEEPGSEEGGEEPGGEEAGGEEEFEF